MYAYVKKSFSRVVVVQIGILLSTCQFLDVPFETNQRSRIYIQYIQWQWIDVFFVLSEPNFTKIDIFRKFGPHPLTPILHFCALRPSFICYSSPCGIAHTHTHETHTPPQPSLSLLEHLNTTATDTTSSISSAHGQTDVVITVRLIQHAIRAIDIGEDAINKKRSSTTLILPLLYILLLYSLLLSFLLFVVDVGVIISHYYYYYCGCIDAGSDSLSRRHTV